LKTLRGIAHKVRYRTAAIHFQNGTSFNVAKIEGGQSYKDMMRNLSSEMLDEYSRARMVDGLFRQPFAPIYPSVVGQNIKHSPYNSHLKHTESTTHEKSPIELMLSSLVSSTQSYINTTVPLPNIYITFPSRIYATDQGTTTLTEAILNVDIRDIRGLSLAHYLAVDNKLYGLRSAGRHRKPQEYTALVIDYSKEAFSTMVIGPLDSMDRWEDIQIMQYDVDFQLGYNNATDDRHLLRIKQRLDELTSLVGPRGKFFHLILMGDQASQEEFLSVADWGLHDRIERWGQRQFSTCPLPGSRDPTFTGAQAAARMSLIDQSWDEWDFYAQRPLLITRPLSILRQLWMEIRLNVEAYSWALKRYFVPESTSQRREEAERPTYLIGQ
jgi:hypothetical protein